MLKKYEKLYKALSDKSRLRILKMLQVKPLCVCEITSLLNLAISTVSKHLSILKNSGLIVDEKDGKWVNYKLNNDTKDNIVLNILLFIRLSLNNDEIIVSDRERALKIDRRLI